ncbi:hypothetical protein [Jannaschia formosa]|uniref:hypothetical protein n=1 Tax=Jannaschia formosa TaxID=2259592 RepID=UPI000E1B982F|nr:hypothetical protein [Jannaschia formosa]TFL18146.1 hypothetical protein DR046_10330 [Jannaschia formosa]
MANDDYVFVQITKILMATPHQARQALTIARVLNSETVSFHLDADGTELSTQGADYLLEDGTDDHVGAFCDIPSPESLLGIEELRTISKRLTAAEVHKQTGHTMDEWVQRVSKSRANE